MSEEVVSQRHKFVCVLSVPEYKPEIVQGCSLSDRLCSIKTKIKPT